MPSHASDKRPRILTDPASPDHFAVELDKIFDQAGGFHVRGRRVVRLVMHGGTLISEELKPAALSLEVHQHSRPYAYEDTPFGQVERDVPVSKFMSEMYLSKGSWGLPVFNGVSTMPIFHEDGSFRYVEGSIQRLAFSASERRKVSISASRRTRPTTMR